MATPPDDKLERAAVGRQLQRLVEWMRLRGPGAQYGVCGSVVCQVCGELIVFTGWVAAVYVAFDRGDAVRGWNPSQRGSHHSHTAEEIAGMRATAIRFC